jgi:restriction system protein
MTRQKYTKLSRQDFNALKNSSSIELKLTLVTLAGIIAFCGGNVLVLFFGTWTYFSVNLRIEYVIGLTAFLLIGLTTMVLISTFWILRSIITKRKDEINRLKTEIDKRNKAIQISDIDIMSGIEFEHYLQRLLIHRGYQTQLTKGSGDLGVDIIASRGDEKIAIQAKRYEGAKVSRRTVSDAVGGLMHYGCNKAMVITNNYFTQDAIKLAQSNGCKLVDRDTLANWIIEYQNSSP